jgi:hypothetical protein
MYRFWGLVRGDEVFHTDLYGLLKYSQTPLIEDDLRYVLIPLLGRFKNEEGEQYHLVSLAYETHSGIKIGTWVDRLVMVKTSHRQMAGLAFSDHLGRYLPFHWMEMEILDRLHRIQTEKPEVIPRDSMFMKSMASRALLGGAPPRRQRINESTRMILISSTGGGLSNKLKVVDPNLRCKIITLRSGRWFQVC